MKSSAFASKDFSARAAPSVGRSLARRASSGGKRSLRSGPAGLWPSTRGHGPARSL